MTGIAGIARAPYLCVVYARVCDCNKPPKELGSARTLERAIGRIQGYWNVYLTFFGDQLVWLHFQIVDLRDGTIVWRDGETLIKEEKKSEQA